MANYDLTYEGSVVQDILDTGKSLEDNGYIFMGAATTSTAPGTPTERVAYIGGPGTYNNFGSTTVVPSGSVGVFKYNGSAWVNDVIAATSDGCVYAGIATPTTNPGTPTGNVFYVAVTAGTYTNFGGLTVSQGISVLKYNGSAWSVEQVVGIDEEPTAGSDNLLESKALVAGGGVNFSITGNGSTVVAEDNALKGLVVGKKYCIYADAWNVSDISNSTTVFMLYYNNGNNVTVATFAKPSVATNGRLFVTFVAVQANYKIYFRGNVGAIGRFKLREYDYAIDDGIMRSVKGGVTSSDEINQVLIELYSEDSSFIEKASTIIECKTQTTSDGRKQIIFNYSDSTNDGFTLEQKPNGIYQLSSTNKTYAYVKNWVDVNKLSATVNTTRLVDKSANPIIAGYLASIEVDDTISPIINRLPDNYQQMQNFSIVGEGSTVVNSEDIISGLTVGNKYLLFANVWGISDKAGSDIVFKLYYDSGGGAEVVEVYKKRQLHDYMLINFVAQADSYSIQLYGDNGVAIPFFVCAYNDILEKAIIQSRTLQNETIKITGNGASVIEEYGIIKGLIVGEKYHVYANKWALSEVSDSQFAFQLFYQNDGNVVVAEYTKKQLPDIINIEFTAASDNYSINIRANNGTVVPISVTKANERLDKGISNYWKGKNIAWYGTSIPAGGVAGNYPQMIGNILGAVIYNYAKGSSSVTKGNTYLEYDRNMGHTIAEKIAAVKDMWTIDDANQTFTNGPRTMGITGIPNYTTYAQVKAARLSIITASYEVIILVRTLLSDDTERDDFLQASLGDLYTRMMTDHASSFAYHDIDLWVLDHGHNNNCSTDPSQIDMSQVNLTSFVGAMNYYIGLIYQYKNHPRIVIVSDYDNFDEFTKKYTIETQQAIADRWHLPVIRIDKYLPFNINTKIRTRGYWDASGYWHDTGFVWGSLDGNMIGNGHFNDFIILKFYESGRPARTIEELTALLNPSQDDNGDWWYDLEPRYIWLYDGLHPASVANGNALRMYAEPLAELLKAVGTNGGYN